MKLVNDWRRNKTVNWLTRAAKSVKTMGHLQALGMLNCWTWMSNLGFKATALHSTVWVDLGDLVVWFSWVSLTRREGLLMLKHRIVNPIGRQH